MNRSFIITNDEYLAGGYYLKVYYFTRVTVKWIRFMIFFYIFSVPQKRVDLTFSI